MNLWFRLGERFVCAPPKCGGTALYCAALGISPGLGRDVFSTALGLVEFVTPDDALASGLPAYLAVRDPLERFASLWRDKCRDGDPNLPLSGLTPDGLMDFIEADPGGDPHWMAQAHWYRSGVETVPFTDLGQRLGLPAVRTNTTRPDDTPMPVERIRRHYGRDFVL